MSLGNRDRDSRRNERPLTGLERDTLARGEIEPRVAFVRPGGQRRARAKQANGQLDHRRYEPDDETR